jgi:hypothetical protein
VIKFFRQIRQNLVIENKTSKYFKYAIGEIILVVIGILIALQINNWNEEQNDKKIELGYMQNIVEDLNDDIEIYKNFENSNHIIYSLIDSIVPNIKSTDRTSKISDISYWVRKVTMQWNIIHPVERTFEEMKSSGHLRLIKHKDIANAISNYYNSLSEFNGYNEAGMLWAADYVEAIGKIFDGELLLKIMRENKKQKTSKTDMLTEDPIIINELINSLQYFNGALLLGEAVSLKKRKKATELIKIISATYQINKQKLSND